ncbi:sugar ABC transporter substrate-binding protein (plasmid) [Phaeobacter inhibens]|uniref:ABC transporter substrate-binding protein n=1 Tax=Phaeobacter inhibens TaxID=221822 RepID=UPI000971AE1F|nr:extracellular solute-binding protein [Phaeobacter inhibens]APX18037.1 sugar ABC transporter substrate-binding protein [Phaeobacter inhibens]
MKEITLAATFSTLLTPAFAGELVINTDTSDPAPKAAFEALIEGFEAEHPDIHVTWNVFDTEGYKTSIRNFLSAQPPDVITWNAGNRMRPYVDAGLFEPLDTLWTENDLDTPFLQVRTALTLDGSIWGIPYTYYPWGLYFRKDILDENGIAPPETWGDLLTASAKLREVGVTPISIGTKYLWTAAGVFDYVNLRQNGYDFHMALTRGEVPWTDDRVKATMARWQELIEAGAFLENHPAFSFQEALAPLVQGEAAMSVTGNFVIEPLRAAGLKDEQIGFVRFPVIDPAIAIAEDAPIDTLHIPAGATNKEDAATFLIYAARADVQSDINAILGQLPVNAQSPAPEDPFLSQGHAMLSETPGGMAQFFDRDAKAEMAQMAMEGFQEFMVKPERLDKILERLEKGRERIYR